MRRQIRNQLLAAWDARRIEGIEAIGCTFTGSMRLPQKPGDWNIIRDCRAVNCSHNGVGLSGVAFERCELDGCERVAGRVSTFLYVCVFDRVVLKGRLPYIFFKPYYRAPGTSTELPEFGVSLHYEPALQHRWERSMHRYYWNVDWALDIRSARFRSSMSFPGVPGDLIRRDPENHILIKRERLADGGWCEIAGSAQFRAIENFLCHSPFDSLVLAASSDVKRRARDLEILTRLRDLGIAEPS